MFIFLPGSESYQSFWNIHPIRTQILWTSWPAVNQWTVYWTKSNRNCWPAKDAGKKDWNAFKSCININQFQVFLCNLPVDWILLNLFFIAFDIILLFISSWEDKWGREADSSHPDPHGCAPCRPIQHWSTHHRGWGLYNTTLQQNVWCSLLVSEHFLSWFIYRKFMKILLQIGSLTL